jgi:hypothetical protein
MRDLFFLHLFYLDDYNVPIQPGKINPSHPKKGNKDERRPGAAAPGLHSSLFPLRRRRRRTGQSDKI